MDTTHKNSHIVYIRRLPQFASDAQKDLEEYFNESQRSIGSYFAAGSVRTATGLSPTEEDLLMPYILSIPKDDKEFRKAVTGWFEGISTKIPGKIKGSLTEGIALEIGLDKDNSEPVSAENLPISVTDFIRWRHAIGHKWVAASHADGKGNKLKQYYVFDPSEVSRTTINTNEQRDKALGYYLSVKDNPRTVTMYLTLLGVRTTLLRKGEEVVKLRELVDKDPATFILLYNDKDKEIKYVIEDMINNNILERVNTRILIKENGEQIGRDMKEAILYLKDSKYTKTYNALKARLQEAWKRTSVSMDTDDDLLSQLPEEPETPPAKVKAADTADSEDLIPAKELIPAAAVEEQVAAEGTAGDIED